jgi:hypothetical protein
MVMWKNILQPAVNDSIRRMLFACWITKAANTYSEFLILVCFPSQKWLLERALVLRYRYIEFIILKRGTNILNLVAVCW